jgi:elongation factor 1 alpha-like protein
MSTSTKESVGSDLKDLSITEPERIKSKNLDVLAEYRKVERKNAANFVVIGQQPASNFVLN